MAVIRVVRASLYFEATSFPFASKYRDSIPYL
jgi:hypothetical protein